MQLRDFEIVFNLWYMRDEAGFSYGRGSSTRGWGWIPPSREEYRGGERPALGWVPQGYDVICWLAGQIIVRPVMVFCASDTLLFVVEFLAPVR